MVGYEVIVREKRCKMVSLGGPIFANKNTKNERHSFGAEHLNNLIDFEKTLTEGVVLELKRFHVKMTKIRE